MVVVFPLLTHRSCPGLTLSHRNMKLCAKVFLALMSLRQKASQQRLCKKDSTAVLGKHKALFGT